MPTLLQEKQPTRSGVLADLPEALAGEGMELVDLANTIFEQPTRLEPRYNKHGKLRGIAWRERNKERKGVWYVGANSKDAQRKQQWAELKPQFERTANTAAMER